MNRVVFLIDGFNIYHALNDNPKYHKYKWLDFSKLAKLYVKTRQSIEGIFYFTALAVWSQDKMNRHKKLITALLRKNVSIIYGAFRKVDKRCRKCSRWYQTFEEKQTDVNIAVHLIRLALEDRFDTAIIVSADSDLIPAIQTVHTYYPGKRIGIVIPMGRKAEELKQECDFHMKLKEKHLRASLLPKRIDLGRGRYITCPSRWS